MGSDLDMVARLLEACVDWDGSQMADLEEPRRVPTCGELRAAADALEAQAVELDALRSIIQTYSDAHEAAVRQGVQMRDRMEETTTIRVCPVRDAQCPHGVNCPYSQGWDCDIKASRAALEAKPS